VRIVTVRRISQGFFLIVFLWFCVAATVGTSWWRLRGWPVNWFLNMDPLTALVTGLSTGSLFASLAWALPVMVLTLFLGRFFCGFICPLGALNQLTGWLARLGRGPADRVEDNRPRQAQAIKYYLLIFLLGMALLGSVQTGIFDPLPLLYRGVNLALAPVADSRLGVLGDDPPAFNSAWLLGTVVLGILGLNLVLPRFFCRFMCPLGALFGLMSRFTPWRIGKTAKACGNCRICDEYCEGGCHPGGRIRHSECVMCLNCLDRCPAKRITFAARPSAGGELPGPELSRRAVLLAGAGALMVPMWRTGALAGSGRDPGLIRPPGTLDEDRFLARCIRCGQCMRVCPGNIIQPALFEAGVQGLWTPAVNYRVGRSGCQPTCIACGQICPTAAIRPISLEEKQGRGDFASQGPVRMGTAFVDRSRCLPWVMGRPCLVCHELCPVSPKAIYTRTVFEPVRDGLDLAARLQGQGAALAKFPAGVNLASGDYYLRQAGLPSAPMGRIVGLEGQSLLLDKPLGAQASSGSGLQVDILVRLQRPYVDPARCIGCGMCEHGCPISGLRAIRVYSENESRSQTGRMLV